METENSNTSNSACNHMVYATKAMYGSLALAIFVVGFATYSLLEQKLFSNDTDLSTVSRNQSYEEGFNAARKLVEESSLGKMIQSEDDIRFVSGVITAIEGTRVTIHDESIQNPFEKNIPSDRVVVIDQNTQISLYTMSGDTEKTTLEMPKKFKTVQTKAVTAAELRIGDLLTVTAAENIKTSIEFSATEIQIVPRRELIQ